MGKKKNRYIIYSDQEGDNNQDADTLEPSEQKIRIRKSVKGRGGKTATVVAGFIGQEDDLKDLCKQIKQHCGVGGSAKEGEIILQGELKEKVISYLKKIGYSDVK